MKAKAHETLIATLGSEPQVVTLALDQLRARGYAIDQVVVVYTADAAVLQAMARVASEFDGAVMKFNKLIQL